MSDKEREQTEKTAFTGVLTCGFGLALNVLSVVTANSLVLVADFFNSLLEFCSISLSWYALRRLRREEKGIFNYGLGKIENLASLLVGIFMLASVAVMAGLIIGRLLHPVRLKGFGIWLGIGCTLVFGLMNAFLWMRSRRHMRAAPSPVVEAQKRLFAVKTAANACMFGNFVLSLAVAGKWVMYLDPLASCFTLALMVNSGWHLMRHSVRDLLDRSLDEPLQLLITRELVRHFEAYTALEGVRSRYSGRNIFIEIFLGFDPSQPLGKIQEVADELKSGLEKSIPHSEVTVVPRARK